MQQQEQKPVIRERTIGLKSSEIGTRLMLMCQRCRKTFDAAMLGCPYCGNDKFIKR